MSTTNDKSLLPALAVLVLIATPLLFGVCYLNHWSVESSTRELQRERFQDRLAGLEQQIAVASPGGLLASYQDLRRYSEKLNDTSLDEETKRRLDTRQDSLVAQYVIQALSVTAQSENLAVEEHLQLARTLYKLAESQEYASVVQPRSAAISEALERARQRGLEELRRLSQHTNSTLALEDAEQIARGLSTITSGSQSVQFERMASQLEDILSDRRNQTLPRSPRPTSGLDAGSRSGRPTINADVRQNYVGRLQEMVGRTRGVDTAFTQGEQNRTLVLRGRATMEELLNIVLGSSGNERLLAELGFETFVAEGRDGQREFSIQKPSSGEE